jgi:hypothetical protein
MGQLVYANVLGNGTTSGAFRIDITVTPDSNGHTLPPSAVPTQVKFVRMFTPLPIPDDIEIFTIGNTVTQELTDARTRASSVVNGQLGNLNIVVNGQPQFTMNDLLPAYGASSVPDSSVVGEVPNRWMDETAIYGRCVIEILISESFAIPGVLTVTYERRDLGIPSFIGAASEDPHVIFPNAFVPKLQYNVTSQPYGISLRAQRDAFGQTMPADHYPTAVHWIGLDTDLVQVHGVGMTFVNMERDILATVESSDIDVVTVNNLGTFTTLEPFVYRSFDAGYVEDNAASYDQIVRIDRPIGLPGPGTLYVTLNRFADLYRNYILNTPPLPVPAPPIP